MCEAHVKYGVIRVEKLAILTTNVSLSRCLDEICFYVKFEQLQIRKPPLCYEAEVGAK